MKHILESVKDFVWELERKARSKLSKSPEEIWREIGEYLSLFKLKVFDRFGYKKIFQILGLLLLLVIIISMLLSPKSHDEEAVPTTMAAKRSFSVEVRTFGELESANSISIASNIRIDQPKAIYVIRDGSHVNKDDLLVKVDPTPYEKRVEELSISVKEAESQVIAAEQALQWEIDQAQLESKTAFFEMESAELELNKVIHGDGPLEDARLKSAMLKAKVKYEELGNYAEDLIALEAEGYLDPIEVKQTQKKLCEEKESYENAAMQYESYIQHVHPCQVKKAQTALKRLRNKQEESSKNAQFKIFKSQNILEQAKQVLSDTKKQLEDAKVQLLLTEIKAPSPGMVVLKEDFRGTVRRKLRVGDILMRNQPIIDLPDLSSMIVKTKVREIDLYKVEVGKPATVGVDAYPDLALSGTVNFIGILAMADIGTPGGEKFFEVRVALDHVDPRLRPGMTSRVIIHADQVEDQLSVPIHSVFEIGKNHYCYRLERKSYVKQPVKIGVNNDSFVAILSGLNENDRICLSEPPEIL